MVGDHGHTVVAVQVQVGTIILVHRLHRDGALTHGHVHAQRALQICEDGPLCDLAREAGHRALQEIVVVQDEGLALDAADALEVPEGLPHRKARPCGERLVADDLLEGRDLGHGVHVVAGAGLGEGFEPAQLEGGAVLGQVGHAHALAVDGLDVALLREHGDGAADRVVRALEALDQLALGRDEGLVGPLPRPQRLQKRPIDVPVDRPHTEKLPSFLFKLIQIT